MAVPKKRTGHSAQGKRRSNWKATKPTLTKCPNCGQAVLTHTVCTACGTYKGKPVSKKGVADVPETPAVEEVKEAKKPRKSTKKSKVEEKAEETKAEDAKEEVAEEAKTEETTEEKSE